MTKRKIDLARALHTAALWHSDDSHGGRQMLSLSSTRKIHSEEHRSDLLVEIKQDIRSCMILSAEDIDNVRRLLHLYDEVEHATIGKEWLTFDQNNFINEFLHKAGML